MARLVLSPKTVLPHCNYVLSCVVLESKDGNGLKLKKKKKEKTAVVFSSS